MNDSPKQTGNISGKPSTTTIEQCVDECNDLEQRSTLGKRFARRAKRWAELQQRRQNSRTANGALYSQSFVPRSAYSNSLLTNSSSAFRRRQIRTISNRDASHNHCLRSACEPQMRHMRNTFMNSSQRTAQLVDQAPDQIVNVELAAMRVGVIPFSDQAAEPRNHQEHVCGQTRDGSFFDMIDDVAHTSSDSPTSNKPHGSGILHSIPKEHYRYYTPRHASENYAVPFDQCFIMNVGSKQEAFISVYRLPAELHVYSNTWSNGKHAAVVRMDTCCSSSSSLSSSSSSRASSSRAREECSSSSSDEDLLSWVASDLANVSIQCGDYAPCAAFDAELIGTHLNELREVFSSARSSFIQRTSEAIEENDCKEGLCYYILT